MTSVGSPSNVLAFRAARSEPPSARARRTAILHVAAGEEELVEIAPVFAALESRPSFRQIVAQASDEPKPADLAKLVGIHPHLLTIAGDSHGERTAAALLGFEALLHDEEPDVVVVAGDDEIALAAAIAAVKQQVAVARLGAGLRSWDWTQTDEVNRTVIDRLADTLFTVSEDAGRNLRAEGVPDGRIHFVGNTRVDTLRRHEARARAKAAWRVHAAEEHGYTLVILRRPASVAVLERLSRIAEALGELTSAGPVLLLQQPSTRALLATAHSERLLAVAGVRSVGPLGYAEALSLKAGAGAIVTDADTVQEEASALGVSCYTLMETTARAITLTHGTNVLLGHDPSAVPDVKPAGRAPTPSAIPMWDGHAAERVAEALVANYTLAAPRVVTH